MQWFLCLLENYKLLLVSFIFGYFRVVFFFNRKLFVKFKEFWPLPAYTPLRSAHCSVPQQPCLWTAAFHTGAQKSTGNPVRNGICAYNGKRAPAPQFMFSLHLHVARRLQLAWCISSRATPPHIFMPPPLMSTPGIHLENKCPFLCFMFSHPVY